MNYFQVNQKTIVAILKACEDELDTVQVPNIEYFEKWLERQSKVLSENHYLQIGMG